MEISAKLFQILPPETGEGKNGAWKKQFVVVETQDQYPKKICFEIWNDKVALGNLSVGSPVKVFFDPESREWQGKWFTSLRAWRIDAEGAGSQGTGNSPAYQDEMQAANIQAPSASGDSFNDESGSDDLPF